MVTASTEEVGPLNAVDEDRTVAAVVKELAAERGESQLADIEAVARGEYQRLAEQSRFDDYMPLLVRKRVRDALRAQ